MVAVAADVGMCGRAVRHSAAFKGTLLRAARGMPAVTARAHTPQQTRDDGQLLEQ
jgi:hypothetical protein